MIIYNEGKDFYILSFLYYKKIIEKIIQNNPDKEYLIIIYYLSSEIDDIIIKLLIKYITDCFDKINIEFVTEYEYYNEEYNELQLIYNSSLNDIVILSNSTFGYWMTFFKIIYTYEKDKVINSIYFGKYLKYMFIDDKIKNAEMSAYLNIDQMLDSKTSEIKFIKCDFLLFDDDCSLDNDHIYYFYCLKYDLIRILLVILYFKIIYKKNINDIVDGDEISRNYKLLNSNCKKLIIYCYHNYNTLIEDEENKKKFKSLLDMINENEIDFNTIINNISYIDKTLETHQNDFKYKYLKYKLKYKLLSIY